MNRDILSIRTLSACAHMIKTGTHLQNHRKNFNILRLYFVLLTKAIFNMSMMSTFFISCANCFSCSCVIISEILVSDCKGTDFLAIILAKSDFLL